MKGDRLFEIIYILLNKKQVTARELADHFEVSVRTIYRDIDTLAGASIPIYAMKGKGGGIRLMEGFNIHEMVLKKEEKEAILSSLSSLRGLGDEREDAVLKKLGTLFNQQGGSWLEVDLRPWGDTNKGKDTFSKGKEAILSGRLLSFTYVNTKGERKKRIVEPVKLLFKSQTFYLLAFPKGEDQAKFFKLFRMGDVEVLEETFEKREALLPEYVYPSKNDIEIKLHIDASMGHRVYDEFLDEEVEVDETGGFQIRKMIDGDSWWLHYFLSYGKTLRILSPPEWQEKIKKEIEKMKEYYS